ncbi:MAG: tripartite tricarboxylate transporter permease [Phycisphaerales bacterium]|nr:tripartite tricarboxylate transporter permease [Phycisphaerales bacterium]
MEHLIAGLMNVFTLSNFTYCVLGAVLGTLVGVLPGLGPSSTLAILLPITAQLDPTGAIIMLAGVCYGAMYGGSTTSILVNVPGEVASVVTCYDGFPMTRQGRGGQALWIAAVGSFVAGTLGVIGISVIGPGLAKLALKFGPPEYFGLLIFSLSMLIGLAGSSLVKGVAAGLAGMLLATVGVDPMTGTARMNFGITELTFGFNVIPVVVGLFGIGEMLSSAQAGQPQIYQGKLGPMTPPGPELKRGLWATLRGTALGFLLGLIPGMVTALPTFFSYDLEKRLSRHPERFGTGVIEGVAGPEAANNATAQAGFIPLLSLGIPTAPSMALLLAAFTLYGVQPGPLIFQQNTLFVWTVIASMYIGNVMCLALNLPLIGLWARLALIPYRYLAPAILAICVIGAYSTRNAMFDVWVALLFGLLGFYMKKRQWPTAPLILGFMLGPMIEIALRQTVSMGQAAGNIVAPFLRPIPVAFMILAVIAVATSFYLRRGRVPREVWAADSET